MKRGKGFYSISVVAKMFSVHQQTIRLYEKEGLIAPHRSEGNTRMFSEDDVERLEEIIYLTHKMGINLAGVEMVLGLQKKVKKLQGEINKLFEKTQESLEEDEGLYRLEAKKNAKKLLKFKDAATISGKKRAVDIGKKSKETEDSVDGLRVSNESVDVEIVDDWEVEYDDE
jgi:MerR family transcriptional regulator, heat shock protein HspR